MAKIWPVHYVLGMAGIAVIRNWMTGDETAQECAEDLRTLANRFSEDQPLKFQLDIPNMDVETGYRLWADTYDDLHNPLISVEESIVRRMTASIRPVARSMRLAARAAIRTLCGSVATT